MLWRVNCWEFKNCGREPGGKAEGALGGCPAACAQELDGINHGCNGGRVCWGIAGTLCGGAEQGTFAMKFGTCIQCDFYKRVVKEEGRAIASASTVQQIRDEAQPLPK